MRLLLGLATASTLVAAAPSIAEACSAYACGNGAMTPVAGGSIPANLPGVYWRPMGSGTEANDPTKVELTASDAPATLLPFTATPLGDGAYVLVPTQPLAAGKDYVVTDKNQCDYSSQAAPSTSFTAAAQTSLPSTLGTVAMTSDTVEMMEIATYSGSCSADIVANRVTFALNLDASAMPWATAFHMQTYVDGVPWTRTESAPLPASLQGTFYVYRTCEAQDQGASPGLSVGPHEVKVKATIPGTTVELWSEPLTVELYCPGESDENGDNIPDLEQDSGCHVAGGASSSWLLLALVGLYSGRRKRQR